MKYILFIISFCLIIPLKGESQESQVCLEQTYKTWIDSKYVGDRYQIRCYIPNNQKTSKDSMPILFVLDADMSFGLTYDVVRLLVWGREIPEVAIVGIAYGTNQATWWQKRSRDYTPSKDKSEIWGKWPLAGGGDEFKNFIEKELFPFVADEYSLNSSNKTLIGLSLGGLICMDILFTNPDLFKRYIVAGPALQWNNREIFNTEQKYYNRYKNLDRVVFTSIGSLDNQKNIINPWIDFNDQIRHRNYNDLIYEAQVIKGESHLSMFPSALTKGLKFVFNTKKH